MRLHIVPLALLAFAATAEVRPDLSGTWKLNIGKSNFGELPAPERRVLEIKHRDPDLTVSVDGNRLVYTTDKRECANTWPGHATKSTLEWDGAVLIFHTKGTRHGEEFQMTDGWMLSAKDATLTINRHASNQLGETRQMLIFEKQ